MKKVFLILCLILSVNSYSQRYRYFPSLKDVFLERAESESLFTKDLIYFRTFLKETTSKMFYRDLQSSTARDGYGGFYSLGLIPRLSKSHPIFNTGVNLLFDSDFPNDDSRIDITLNQSIKKENNIAFLDGDLNSSGQHFILEFSNSILIPLDSHGKENFMEGEKSQFIISQIDYQLTQSKFTATIKGKFDGSVKFTKNGKIPKTINSINAEATKDRVIINISYVDQKDQNQIFTITQEIE